jgi:hypothetical protein
MAKRASAQIAIYRDEGSGWGVELTIDGLESETQARAYHDILLRFLQENTPDFEIEFQGGVQ